MRRVFLIVLLLAALLYTPVHAGPSSAVVSGAGSAAVNATYVFNGTSGGKSAYVIPGSPAAIIQWAGSTWIIVQANGTLRYTSADDVAFPWLVTTWEQSGGASPVPTVTELKTPSGSVSGNAKTDGAVKQ